jgi:hypothetical protein
LTWQAHYDDTKFLKRGIACRRLWAGPITAARAENSGAHDGSVALALASLAGCQLVDIAQASKQLAAVLRFAGDV